MRPPIIPPPPPERRRERAIMGDRSDGTTAPRSPSPSTPSMSRRLCMIYYNFFFHYNFILTKTTAL